MLRLIEHVPSGNVDVVEKIAVSALIFSFEQLVGKQSFEIIQRLLRQFTECPVKAMRRFILEKEQMNMRKRFAIW